jgi:hypothetical protein
MPGHEAWRRTINEMELSCPLPGHANDKVRRLFFDTINNMTVKGWTDSEENRVFARHIAVWMNHCTDPIPPIEHDKMASLVQTHLKNYNTVDLCRGGCDCAKAARAMIDILNSIEQKTVEKS